MKERPERIFYGSAWFYISKIIGLFIAIITAFSCIFIPALVLFLYISGKIEHEPPPLWLALLLVFIAYGIIWALGNWLFAFPEIGISKNYIWFRHFGIWQALRWVDIGVIDESQQYIEGGLYIYSEKLPIYQRFTTFDPGIKARVASPPLKGKKGRALFVSPMLNGYGELSIMIPKLRWKAVQRRYHEKQQGRFRN